MDEIAELYAIEKELGVGGGGRALLIKDKLTEEVSVLKVIRKVAEAFAPYLTQLDQKGQVEVTEKCRQQAKREVECLAKLRHRNIVEYRNFFEDSENFYIIMEYCDGGDLCTKIEQRMDTQNLFTEEEVMDIFIQVARALSYIHQRKIIHRDLKPLNIFLTSKNVVKIGDFGISTELDSTRTAANTKCGTLGYLCPEILNEEPYDYKSDIWALGVLLFQTVSLGQHPFAGLADTERIRNIMAGNLQPIPPVYSDNLRTLLTRLLHPDPARRLGIDDVLRLPCIIEIMEKTGKIQSGAKFMQSTMRNTMRVASKPTLPGAVRMKGVTVIGGLFKALKDKQDPTMNYHEFLGDHHNTEIPEKEPNEVAAPAQPEPKVFVPRPVFKPRPTSAPLTPDDSLINMAEKLCVIVLEGDFDMFVWNTDTKSWDCVSNNLDESYNVDENATVCAVDDQLYLFNFEDKLAFCKAAPLESDSSWTKKKGPIQARICPSAVALGGAIYVLGGKCKDGFSVSPLFQRYLIEKDKWETLIIPSEATRVSGIFTYDGMIHMLGGESAKGATQSLQTYNPNTSSWNSNPRGLDKPAAPVMAAVVGGVIYITNKDALYTYDMKRLKTTKIATWPDNFSSGSMSHWQGKVVVCLYAKVCIYDPSTKSVETLPEIPSDGVTCCFTL